MSGRLTSAADADSAAVTAQTPTDDPIVVEAVERELPAPTFWPAALALGLTSLCFGVVTAGIFFYAGVIVLAIALFGWMRTLLLQGDPQGLSQRPSLHEPAVREQAQPHAT